MSRNERTIKSARNPQYKGMSDQEVADEAVRVTNELEMAADAWDTASLAAETRLSLLLEQLRLEQAVRDGDDEVALQRALDVLEMRSDLDEMDMAA